MLPGGDLRARRWLDAVTQAGDDVFSSMLLHLELARVLRREGLDVSMARPVLDRVNLVSIDDGVLRFAAAIEAHIKSLDAIHLATCALLGANIRIVTHDAQMSAAAASLGLETMDPLA
ncbi:MAG: PIN domain-containing protein [Rhodanobacteraceae bacterium]|nr:PIN domain-containing protein [Rhodanobacteraceae bacterium]